VYIHKRGDATASNCHSPERFAASESVAVLPDRREGQLQRPPLGSPPAPWAWTPAHALCSQQDRRAVALANKNARILWAVMTKGHAFDARHVSVRPG
jgi:hypothetical protein